MIADRSEIDAQFSERREAADAVESGPLLNMTPISVQIVGCHSRNLATVRLKPEIKSHAAGSPH